MTRAGLRRGHIAVSPYLLEAARCFARGSGKPLAHAEAGDFHVGLHRVGAALWAIVRRGKAGGLALCAARWTGDADIRSVRAAPGETARFAVRSSVGVHRIAIKAAAHDLAFLRVTTSIEPAAPTLIPFHPRDLLPLGIADDPLRAVGHVEAVQRGLNAGVVYFTVERPALGNFLYFQNLTALGDYFEATGTTPDESVGGVWPELGFALPPAPSHRAADAKPLPAGREIILSDAILVCRSDKPEGERDTARQFLQMLGAAYRLLELPDPGGHDWVGRAERTLQDLDTAAEATIRHYGHRYVHPYTAAEYPDAMVQMSIVQAIHEWSKWTGEPHPLAAEFFAGMGKFFDAKLGTIRRYLPNVGDDKDAEAIDSWYLYHPLLNLGRLAIDGDRAARRLFLNSLDYGIRAARHFDYKWPIQYKAHDFSVIEESAGADGRGQTDVGGIYAWVMLQAFELTEEQSYLDEARAAIDAAVGLGFGINYQANLTAWGAAACMRLWRITARDIYLEQSYVYLASFFHNSEIWESRIGNARHFSNFLGVTALQDAPYMALYECFDSYTAFEHYLSDSGPDLEPAARMLISEYCRYALDRAWYYYPDALPDDAVADKQREHNGHVDRTLSFPLEDLYADGQPAGQVGQEIYGAGAAMIFATRAFHPVEGAPFLIFCDHFLRASERNGETSLSLLLDGGETCRARLNFVRRRYRKLGAVSVMLPGGDRIRPSSRSDEHVDFVVPANGRLIVDWEKPAKS